jgi:hypothetical protein
VRPSAVFVALVLGSLVAAPARARSPETQVLVDQGRRFETEGRAELAAELFRAALVVDPDDFEARRLLAENLKARGLCAEAVPEYRAYVRLAPAGSREGDAWDQAVVNLAQCLRGEQGRLELASARDARCTVDGGLAREVPAGGVVAVEVPAGERKLSCEAGEAKHEQAIRAVAGQAVRVDLFAAAPAAAANATGTLRLLARSATSCVVSGQPSIRVGPEPLELEALPGGHRVECTAAGFAPFVRDVALAPGAVAEVRITFEPTAGAMAEEFGLPPVDPPSSKPAPLRGRTGLVEVRVVERDWRCRVGDRALEAPNAAGELLWVLPAGEHRVSCERPGAAPFETVVALAAGERREVAVRAPSRAPREGATPAPAPTHSLGGLEWALLGGFGPAHGTFGVSVQARWESLALGLGTGFYPLALSGTWYANPGETGLYVNAGWLAIGEGLAGGGSFDEGYGLFAGGGLEIRPSRSLAIRVGVGLGYNSTGFASGPLTFDLAAAFIP